MSAVKGIHYRPIVEEIVVIDHPDGWVYRFRTAQGNGFVEIPVSEYEAALAEAREKPIKPKDAA